MICAHFSASLWLAYHRKAQIFAALHRPFSNWLQRASLNAIKIYTATRWWLGHFFPPEAQCSVHMKSHLWYAVRMWLWCQVPSRLLSHLLGNSLWIRKAPVWSLRLRIPQQHRQHRQHPGPCPHWKFLPQQALHHVQVHSVWHQTGCF